MTKSIQIAVISNEAYVPHVAAMLSSLYEHNQHVHIHLVDTGISQGSFAQLAKQAEKVQAQINRYPFSLPTVREQVADYQSTDQELVLLAPLFLAEVLPPTIEKVLLLDADGLICASVWELFRQDVPLIAGVLDTIAPENKHAAGLKRDDTYINAGMLLINLYEWRAQNLTQECLAYIHQQEQPLSHWDQQVINALFSDRVTILPPRWNVLTPFFQFTYADLLEHFELTDYYSEAELTEAVQQPVFVHMTPSFIARPWVKNCRHPYAEQYWHYRNQTSFASEQTAVDQRSYKAKMIEWLFYHLDYRMFARLIAWREKH